MIRIGTKVRCIANYDIYQDILICFRVGKLYTILDCSERGFVRLKDEYGNVVAFVYDNDFYSNYLWKYFISISEDRKLKLEELSYENCNEFLKSIKNKE